MLGLLTIWYLTIFVCVFKGLHPVAENGYLIASRLHPAFLTFPNGVYINERFGVI